MKNALERILHQKQPEMIRTDKEKEFDNKIVSKLFKDRNIHHFNSQNLEVKANYAEKLIKTLKQRMYRYFIGRRTGRYIDVL